MRRRATLRWIVTVCICSSGIVLGDMFVSFAGTDDNNTCEDSQTPCRTLPHAISNSLDGDTIWLDGASPSATYTLRDITLKKKGILFQSWKKNGAHLACGDPSRQSSGFSGCSANFNDSNIGFKNLDVTDCHVCIYNSNFTARASTFFQAQLHVQVESRTEIQLENVIFQESGYTYGGVCEDDQEETCHSSLAMRFVRTKFIGPNVILHGQSPLGSISALMREVKFEKINQSPTIDNFNTALFLTMEDTELTDANESAAGLSLVAGPGAGLFADIINSSFTNNNWTGGGGLTITARQPKIVAVHLTNCTFARNQGDVGGSGLQLELDADLQYNQTVTLNQCRFMDNTNSECAAAVSSTGGSLHIMDTYFVNNHVTTYTSKAGSASQRKGAGGAINFLNTVTMTMDDCYFSNNTANWFGGSIAGAGNITIRRTYFRNTDSHVHSTVGDILFLTGMVDLQNVSVEVITTEMNLAHIWYSSEYHITSSGNSSVDFYCPVGSQFFNDSLPEIATPWDAYKDLFFYCNPCPSSFYSLQRGFRTGPLDWDSGNWSSEFDCEECSYGGDCTEGVIRSRVNFWGYPKGDRVHLIPCIDGYCCPEEVCTDYQTCAANRTGVLCGECESGMSELLFTTDCIPDDQCTGSWYIVVDVVLSLVNLLFFLYQVEISVFVMRHLFWQDTSNHDPATSGYIKSIFYFYQTIDLLSVQTNQAEGEVGLAIQPFLTYLLSFKPIVAIFGVCPFPGLTPVTKSILNSMQTVYMFALLGVMTATAHLVQLYRAKKRRGDNQTETSTWRTQHMGETESSDEDDKPIDSFKARLATACVSLFLYNYISISNLCFTLLACVPVDDEYVLYYDGHVQCLQPWQYVVLVISLIHVVPFCLVVVVSSFLLKRRYITITQFILSYFLPLPMLLYWAGQWVHSRYRRTRLTSSTSEHGRLVESMEYLETSEQIREEILFVVDEPFIQPEDASDTTRYWEGVLIFRRLALSLLGVFIVDTMLSMTLQTMCCLLFLVWHLHALPFASPKSNYLESFSLVLLTAIAATHLIQATFFSAGKLPEGPSLLQIYVTDWIEFVLVNLLPFLLALLLVVAVVVRLGALIWRGIRATYRMVCRTRYS